MSDPVRERVNVLGVAVSPISIPIAVETIAGWIARREKRYVCVSNVHTVMESHFDPELKRIHNRAGLVTPDGMPLVWLSRGAGHAGVRRVYGPDLMLEVCRASVAQGWTHYLYGGREGVPEKLAARLTELVPGLRIVGGYSPPFRPLSPAEDDAICARINEAKPDIVWVGLGAPKQERWMADHLARLDASVLLGVGAAFDFHTGLKRQAPTWMQKSGLEWLFRLATEPRRLARRYLLYNPAFVWHVACQKLGVRKFPIEE